MERVPDRPLQKEKQPLREVQFTNTPSTLVFCEVLDFCPQVVSAVFHEGRWRRSEQYSNCRSRE